MTLTMNTSLTKKPMKPITTKPNAVCRQILLNSAGHPRDFRCVLPHPHYHMGMCVEPRLWDQQRQLSYKIASLWQATAPPSRQEISPRLSGFVHLFTSLTLFFENSFSGSRTESIPSQQFRRLLGCNR